MLEDRDAAFEPWTRRRFLRVGAASGALLAAGGLLARCVGDDASPGQGFQALTTSEAGVVAALAARMLATDDPAYPSPDSLDVPARIDALVGKLDAHNRADLKQLLQLVEYALPLRAGYASRFSKLSAREQDNVLAAMMTSRIALLRGAFDAVKSLCVMAYFQDARVWGAIGYDGPLVGRPREGWVAAASLRRPR